MKIESRQKNLLIPTAIVIAGALIAGAVYFGSNQTSTANTPQPLAQKNSDLDEMTPVSKDDHIRGNPNAPVKIVEYSDFECPFCKRFHPTMQRAMNEYGKDGKVAWVYRHFPLDQLHPLNARKVAVASECVNEIGGNVAFWQFADRFFELTPSNDQTNITTVIPQILSEINIDQSQFNTCASSGKYDQHIQDDIDNAIATGGRGTPWSIIVSANGNSLPLSGAQPYSSLKQLIDLALQDK